MGIVASLVSGLIFGAGLAISGLINPAKVLAFLDIAGRWDPSLAVVMIAASGVALIGYRLCWRGGRPWFADQFSLPEITRIDARLILGATLFGIGWGLAGYCPGPVIAGLGLLNIKTWVFFLAMAAGMGVAGAFKNRRA